MSAVLVGLLFGWAGIAANQNESAYDTISSNDARLGPFIASFVLLLVGSWLAGVMYFWICQGSQAGATPGQSLVGLQVIRADNGARAGFGKALGKVLVGSLADIVFLLSSLSMLWNPERRTWSDRASGTRVVVNRSPRTAAAFGHAALAMLLPAALIFTSAFSAHSALKNNYPYAGVNNGTGTDSNGYNYPTASPSAADPYGNGYPDGTPSTDGYSTEAPSAGPTSVGMVDLSDVSDDARAQSVGETLDTYFSGINARNYIQSLSMYDPAGAIDPNNPADVQTFISGEQTSTVSDPVVQSITDASDGSDGVVAHLTFVSHQDPSEAYESTGSCTDWALDYDLTTADAGSTYLILQTENAAVSSC